MGATPLFYAISQNNTEMVQLLCKHGARIDSLITLQDEVCIRGTIVTKTSVKNHTHYASG